MLYDYQYCIAAIAMSIALLVIYFSKRSLATRTNSLFLALIFNNLTIASFDLLSCFAVSYKELFPLFVRYGSSLLYLIFYNLEAGLFFLYSFTRLKEKRDMKAAIILVCSVLLVEIIMILSSPFTHLIVYFDANGNYMHGMLMHALYFFSYSELALSLVISLTSKKKLNTYQYFALNLFIILVVCCVILQYIFPRAVIGEFSTVLFLTMLYSALENPAYFRFRQTACFNSEAFFRVVRRNLNRKRSDEMLVFMIRSFDSFRYMHGTEMTRAFSNEIAESLHKMYKEDAFMISEKKFVVVLSGKMQGNRDEIIENVTYMVNHTKVVSTIGTVLDLAIHHLNRNFLVQIIGDGTVEEVFNILLHDYSDEQNVSVSGIMDLKRRTEKILALLKSSIKEENFILHYQPIYCVSSGKFESAEVLVRMKDEELGLISPEEFIPLAEENGLVKALGEIVLKKACAFYQKEALHKYGIKYLEINLSMVQCMRIDMAKELLEIIDAYGMNHSAIKMEITETIELDRQPVVEDNIQKMMKEGVEFSIDDFGSGYAGMNYLLKMPGTMVKLDRTILWNAVKEEKAKVLLLNMIRMSKELNLSVLCEGAETEEMVQLVKNCGCDFIQGYYFSKPVNETGYLAFIREHN